LDSNTSRRTATVDTILGLNLFVFALGNCDHLRTPELIRHIRLAFGALNH